MNNFILWHKNDFSNEMPIISDFIYHCNIKCKQNIHMYIYIPLFMYISYNALNAAVTIILLIKYGYAKLIDSFEIFIS